LRNCIKDNPFDYTNYFSLAELYKNNNRFDEAFEMYVKGFVLNPLEKNYQEGYIQCQNNNKGQKLDMIDGLQNFLRNPDEIKNIKNIIKLFKDAKDPFSRIIVEIMIRNNIWYDSTLTSINHTGLHIKDNLGFDNSNVKDEQVNVSPVGSLERVALDIILYNSTKQEKYIKDASESFKISLEGHIDFLSKTRKLSSNSFDIIHEVCSIFYLFQMCGIKIIEQKMILGLVSSINSALSNKNIKQRQDINKYFLTLSVLYNFNHKECINILGQTMKEKFHGLNKEVAINNIVKNDKIRKSKFWEYLKKLQVFISSILTASNTVINIWDVFSNLFDMGMLREIASIDFKYDGNYENANLFIKKYAKSFPDRSMIIGINYEMLNGKLIKFSNGLVKLVVYKDFGSKEVCYVKILNSVVDEKNIDRINLSTWFDVNMKVYDLLKTTFRSNQDLLVIIMESVVECVEKVLNNIDRKCNKELFSLKGLECICKAV
jgi:tetratricopeptide (TPR) repeat protein